MPTFRKLDESLAGQYDHLFDDGNWLGVPYNAKPLDEVLAAGVPLDIGSFTERDLVSRIFGNHYLADLEVVAEIPAGSLFMAMDQPNLSIVHSTVEALTRTGKIRRLRSESQQDSYAYGDNEFWLKRFKEDGSIHNYYHSEAWHVVWDGLGAKMAEPLQGYSKDMPEGSLSKAGIHATQPNEDHVKPENFAEHTFTGWRLGKTNINRTQIAANRGGEVVQYRRFATTTVYRAIPDTNSLPGDY